ncbi:NAD(P)-dependent dehydrogenase, short-chain alcohol dehydrogenase family [Sphingomonas laterariae]|uniref:Probable oxidoreductase n=1 Tax=Edaphosphingomonas laterariae TaxID=861865 RepID=A0A239G019_9SPHN|nr:SDR family NAD(P)-dependent oxidoreductase [Sphingomonas laterariae]SNS62501.1 NAD(P)-dependent dehydrogenase, short-chain alcohol dehydrogenase family [Sphingomonas laterariae]
MPRETTPPRILSAFAGRIVTAGEVAAGHDLSGRTAIVTGGAGGIGLEIARTLAVAGATVTLAVRSRDAGAAAAAEINRAVGRAAASAAFLDLADLATVRGFTRIWGGRPLDLLIANAGVMATPESRTAQGHESQFGINHLGHFQLATGLVPALAAAGSARVVMMSSAGHHDADVDLDDPDWRRRTYDPFLAYGASKTANNLFAVGFSRHFADDGITANAVHPGAVATALGRHVRPEQIADRGWDFSTIAMQTPEQGAATAIWASTAPELAGIGGLYLEECGEAPPWSAERPLWGVKPYSRDPDRAEALWALSERLVAG